MNARFVSCALLAALLIAPAFADNSTDPAVQHFSTGLAYERLGRFEEAYTELQLGCALNDKEASMALALGVIALRLGRWDSARRTLEHSVVLDADSTASYYELALLYEAQHENNRASDAWHRFLDLNVDPLLRDQGQQHLQFLESAPASGKAEDIKARLVIVLGHAKLLNVDNKVLERSNPVLTATEMLLPAGPGQTLPRIVAATALAPPKK